MLRNAVCCISHVCVCVCVCKFHMFDFRSILRTERAGICVPLCQLATTAGLSNCTKHCHFCCFGERETPVGRASPQPADWRLIRLTAVSAIARYPTPSSNPPAPRTHMLYRGGLPPSPLHTHTHTHLKCPVFGFGNTLTSMAQVS